MAEKKEIIIDLSDSSNAQSYQEKNLIHAIEFEGIRKIIQQRLQRIETIDLNSNKNTKIRYNDTISILGSRGSGKTSFLLSIKDYCDNNIKEVKTLKMIDPTLIEEKGHIFLTILSVIQDAIEKKLEISDCNPNDTSYRKKKEWQEKLRKLSSGIPSIDGVGGSNLNESQWQDAEYIMDKGLKSVKAAADLEENFNEVLEFALGILEKKAFVLMLDDIDVDFLKGWPVIETIRKYLTSPKLIIFLSGDLKLYSKAIRKQQWKSFGKALLINEAQSQRKMNDYNELVTEMEGQYLQKVLKPEYRVHLTTLFEKNKLFQKELEIKIKVKTDELGIIEKYKQVLKTFGIYDIYQSEAYSSFMLNLPIRTQIQFLQGFNSENNNSISSITDTFLSDLYENSINVDLAITNPQILNIIILRLLINKKILSEAYQLQPTSDDISLNGSLTSLSFLFSTQVKKHPVLIFDYFIKIGYIRNILSDIEYDKNGENPYSIEELCKSSGLYQDKVLRDITGNITAYLRGYLNYPNESIMSRYAGTLPIYGLNKSARDKKIVGVKRIDEVFKYNSIEYMLACIPVSISANLWKNSTELTSSIFMLLSSIGEILRRDSLTETNDSKSRELYINKSLLELSQIRTYIMPSFNKKETKGAVEDENLESIEISDEDTDTKFVGENNLAENLRNWIDSYNQYKTNISPHLLGKIITRFFFGLISIEEKNSVNQNLGDAMYRRIIAFINSVIVEEVKEVALLIDEEKILNKNKSFKELSLDNEVSGDRVFNKNIIVADTYKDFLFLTPWLMSCPLILIYLPQKDSGVKLIDNYYNFLDSYKFSFVDIGAKLSIYNQAKDVNVRLKQKNSTKQSQKDITHELPVVQISNENDLPLFECNEKTIETLIKSGVEYSIFTKRYYENERSNNRARNKIIREKCTTYFNDLSIFNAESINQFIKYLDNTDLASITGIDKWKEHQ